MSLTDSAEQVIYGHFTILEIQLHGRRSFNTHFMFFRTLGKSFKPTFNNKRGEFVSINLGKYGVYVSETTICYPAFLAIEKIILSILTQSCCGLCPKGVTSAIRLG